LERREQSPVSGSIQNKSEPRISRITTDKSARLIPENPYRSLAGLISSIVGLEEPDSEVGVEAA
jgi:hypothetical protein